MPIVVVAFTLNVKAGDSRQSLTLPAKHNKHFIRLIFFFSLKFRAKDKEFLDTYENFDDMITEQDKKHDDKKHEPSNNAQLQEQLDRMLTEEQKQQAQMEKDDREREKRSEERKKHIKTVVPRSAMYVDSRVVCCG